MATTLKTQPTDENVTRYIASIKNDERRRDAETVLALMADITKAQPRMWGAHMIGFGTYHYTYASGREGKWFATGFAPRKDRITIYIMPGYEDYTDLLTELGPHTKGKSCLHIRHLSETHIPALKKLIQAGIRDLKKTYPTSF